MNCAKIREEARRKTFELAETFNEMRQSPMYENHALALNMLFLAHACESCFIDLHRHMDFHGISHEDQHKRAAFIFKWVARMRPVWASGPGSGAARAVRLHINSYFALLGALGELDVDMVSFAKSSIAQHIIYEGTYRNVNPETWALVFCMLERQFPK